MPTTEANRQFWDQSYDWASGGAEWSSLWGSTQAQWQGTILPRIQRHLPVHTILEIAPGFGRWTHFLAGFCQRLILVDLSAKCIDACRARFRDAPHIDYFVNDGRSLSFIGDGSVDFVFSFDSLVHVEADVIESYLNELGRILRPGGAGFIHHSNLAELSKRSLIGEFLASHHRLDAVIARLIPKRPTHGRGRSMSASLFCDRALRAGVPCVSQEKVNWGGSDVIDCLSTIEKAPASSKRPNRVFNNPHFMREASYVAQLAQLYGRANVADSGS